MKPNVTDMRAAAADVDELLEEALQILTEPMPERVPPAQLDREAALVRDYLNLAGVALERFQEAANGS